MMGGKLERAPWSDAKGFFEMPRKSVKLGKGWRWATKWQVEGKDVRGAQSQIGDTSGTVDHDGSYDEQGWQYSDHFGGTFSG